MVCLPPLERIKNQKGLVRRPQWDQHGCHFMRAKRASLEGASISPDARLSPLTNTKGSGRGDPLVRASNEHILIVRVPRAGGRPGCPSPLLTLCSSTDYSLAMELPDLKDDAYLKVLRPLVEAYLAFALIDNRHIKSLRLTPSQFDVIATL